MQVSKPKGQTSVRGLGQAFPRLQGFHVPSWPQYDEQQVYLDGRYHSIG